MVRGVGSSGKTTSIKAVREILKRHPGATVEEITTGSEPIVKITTNEIVIIVASAGDTEAIIRDMMDKIAGIDWDILICATKSRGITVTVLDELCQNYPDVVVLHTTRAEEDYGPLNEAMVQQILDHLPASVTPAP